MCREQYGEYAPWMMFIKKGVLQSWWMEHVGHSAQFYVWVGLFICTNQREVFLYHSGTKVQYIFMSL